MPMPELAYRMAEALFPSLAWPEVEDKAKIIGPYIRALEQKVQSLEDENSDLYAEAEDLRDTIVELQNAREASPV